MFISFFFLILYRYLNLLILKMDIIIIYNTKLNKISEFDFMIINIRYWDHHFIVGQLCNFVIVVYLNLYSFT